MWEIDLIAPSIYEAAEAAYKVWQDKDCHANFFTVKVAGKYYNVELDEEGNAMIPGMKDIL